MARFEIHHLEGTQYVDAHLNHEMVRLEAGALSYLQGDIKVHSPLIPSLGGALKSMMADEAVYRPTYSGTGVITMESSLGGFHVLELRGESWILERGAYWASEGSIDVGFHREKMIPSLWAGEGLVYLQTRVRGHGKVVVTTRGPVEEVRLEEGQHVVAEGKTVICRTGDVALHGTPSHQEPDGALHLGRRAPARLRGPRDRHSEPRTLLEIPNLHGSERQLRPAVPIHHLNPSTVSSFYELPLPTLITVTPDHLGGLLLAGLHLPAPGAADFREEPGR